VVTVLLLRGRRSKRTIAEVKEVRLSLEHGIRNELEHEKSIYVFSETNVWRRRCRLRDTNNGVSELSYEKDQIVIYHENEKM